MSSILDNLNEKEKKVRKHWLKLSIFGSFIYPLINFSIMLSFVVYFSSLFKSPTSNSVDVDFTFLFAKLFSLMIFGIILSALVFWWIYHCGYKKPGTALLVFLLILSAVFFFMEIYELCSTLLFVNSSEFKQLLIHEETSNYAYPLKTLYSYLIFTFATWSLLTIWWFILSLQLRKVNKKLQPLMNPPATVETSTT